MPPPAELIALARATAARHALDPALVCAVVEQESSWETHAIRYEPAFRAHYVAPLGLPPTEEVARSISWGLMQVMGQVAREHGFSGKFLSALCEPPAGLDIGCAVLAAKMTIRSGSSSRGSNATEGSLSPAAEDIARALALWNGGANPDYVSQVLARVASYRRKGSQVDG
ncbi:MAG TPA: transglycosylase SLT domain-containing protein [Candidatus Acidoferrales bacterium]|nr:transglycosylase SLT domain-containing protein [Candidatus Acidoferrales bacterium]